MITPRSMRQRRRGSRGVSLVEFAMVSPLGLLLVLGIPVIAVITLGNVQLGNAVRDSVRAAAICGTDPGGNTTLPNGALCSDSNTAAYIQSVLAKLPGDSSKSTVSSINVYDESNRLRGDEPSSCRTGWTIEVVATYQQPLYVPLVGHLLGDGSSNTRAITATAEATCEQ